MVRDYSRHGRANRRNMVVLADLLPNITFEANAVIRARRFAALSVASAAQLPRWTSL